MKLSLGPLLYCWERNRIYDFYEKAQQSSVDIVYVGESVCAKRQELKLEDWLEIGKSLQNTGKEVVITSLALVDSPSKLKDVKNAVNNGIFTIEANDMAAVNLCFEQGLPFTAGNALNLYNAESLNIMLRNGMKRWCLPVELSKQWGKEIQSQAEKMAIWNKFEKELLAYGYLPLSYSARCFTARSVGREKANCGVVCIEDIAGKAVISQDDERIFTMNGIQMQSGLCNNLINEIASMQDFIDIIRLSPLDDHNIFSIIEQYQQALTNPALSFPLSDQECDGYWLGNAGKMVSLSAI